MSINILKTKVYNGKNEPRVPCQIPWLHPVLQDAFKIVLDQATYELTYIEINICKLLFLAASQLDLQGPHKIVMIC